MLAIEYHVHIWQVSPQLSCGDACQILMWYKEPNRYFGRIENLAYGEINERSFSNPHPSTWTLKCLNTRTHRSTITCYVHEVTNRATTLQWQNTSVMVPQSPLIRLFVQQLIMANKKQNMKSPHCWPFVLRIHMWPKNSPHKGRVILKFAHW